MARQVLRYQQLPSIDIEFFKKSHEMVFSQLALSPVEHDLMALMLTRLSEDHWEEEVIGESKRKINPTYEFGIDVLCDWLGVKSADIYNVTQEPASRLAGRKIGIKNSKAKKYRFTPLFEDLIYENGTLTMIPNNALMEQYIGLTKGHSQIPQKVFRNLKRENAKRLFSMLCRFKDPAKGSLKAFDFQDLYGMFGLLNERGELVKKSYQRTSEFIRTIIKPAIKEIDEKEPLLTFHIDEKSGNYGYQPLKSGRKITGIKFLFSWDIEKIASSKPVVKKVASQTEQTDEEVSAVDLLTTYVLVNNYTPDQPNNPSTQQLKDIMEHSNWLSENGKEVVDVRFMLNYKMAIAEARARESGMFNSDGE
ncbi:replication initiation protein [Photobacterium lutimaris]|uniref:Replication initiation protein n=1 Tax=Photobacterium lutimaris TaxID=388278 RepID=A0A2T3ITJ1_9GAMM|nr:replication initiation protein [Photobacterium lutimaris]PSU31668.1 replication initiation protein [Photobacterium lutimaris]TDR72696.1 replication initiator protein [Photobacterium lutimaris]